MLDTVKSSSIDSRLFTSLRLLSDTNWLRANKLDFDQMNRSSDRIIFHQRDFSITAFPIRAGQLLRARQSLL
jgi:hypothetical protein